jgi:hypothetical protein
LKKKITSENSFTESGIVAKKDDDKVSVWDKKEAMMVN